MKKKKLLISALCISMAAAQLPMGVWAATVEESEEIISETEAVEVISEESGFMDFSASEYPDIVEADFAHPSFLDDYGFEELFPLTLEGVVPDGDPDVSHLYTLQAGETLEFTDGVTDEVAVTYSEGDTLALCKGGTAVIKFKPASYDPAKTYNVYAVYNEGYDDMPGDVTDLGNGSYSMEVSYAAMMLNIHGVIDPSSYVPGEFAGGTGTVSDPYQIANYDQLKLMGTQTQEGLYYKLIADITANTSAPDDNSPDVWTPIDPKGCHFDGADHTIKNLCLGTTTATVTEYNQDYERNFSALFGPQGTVAELIDVTVENVHIKGEDHYCAALAIYVTDMSGCKLSGEMTLSDETMDAYYLGGLAYKADGRVSGCIYDAKINLTKGKYIGGIVYEAGDVENCSTTETGYIKMDCEWPIMFMNFRYPNGDIAGIVHTVTTSDSGAVLRGNTNSALIDATCNSTPHDAAGIAIRPSDPDKSVSVSENHNLGKLKGNYVAGIAFSMSGDISNCSNSGEVEGSCAAAGIVYLANEDSTISDCINTGNITATATGITGFDGEFGGAAGIAGNLSSAKAIKNCVNLGKIEAKVAAAGVVGIYDYWKDALFEGCANLGPVSGSEAGGLMFFSEGTKYYDSDGKETGPGRITIKNSYNAGPVKMTNNTEECGWGFGGLIAFSNNADIENCFNAGLVDESLINGIDSYNKAAGGIVGCMRETAIKNCYNIGVIKAGPDSAYAIAGQDKYNAGKCSITGCYYLDGSASNAAGSTDGKPVSGLTATKLYGSAMTKSESFSKWDFDKTWQVGKNETYPYPEITANSYAGEKTEMKESAGDMQIVSSGIFVVNQKFDVTGTDFFGQAYAKYDVVPKGSAKVTKAGLVTVSKVPADGKITINGYVKNGSKFEKEKAYVFTAQKPVVTKTVLFTMPYDGTEDAKSSVLASSLIAGTEAVPSKWISAKESVAKYDEETGRIIAVSKGTAKFTAIFGDPESPNSAKYPVTVKVNIPKINKTAATMQSGATLALKISGAPKGSAVVWSVSAGDAEYVSVDAASGKVSALKYKEGDTDGTAGKVTVKASIDGKEYACYECEVTVIKPSIAKAIPDMKVGKTAKITVKNTKYKAKEGGGITFESDNPEIATVDAKGSVKAVSTGECIIMVSVAGVELECPVKVN